MMKHEKQNIIERGWTNQGTLYESSSKNKHNITKMRKLNEKKLKVINDDDNFSDKLDSYSSVGDQNFQSPSNIDDVTFAEGK